jgi:hypothetical protein
VVAAGSDLQRGRMMVGEKPPRFRAADSIG